MRIVDASIMPRAARARPPSAGASFLDEILYGLVLDGVAGGVLSCRPSCAAGRSSVAWSLRTATRSAGSMFGRAD